MTGEIAIGASILLCLGFGALLLRPAWWRFGPLIGVALALVALVDVSMGRPVPTSLAWGAPQGRLLGFTARAGKAIFVWVQPPNNARPVAVNLPWSDAAADQLAAAQSKRCAGGSFNLTFSRGWGDDPPLTVTEVIQPHSTPKD